MKTDTDPPSQLETAATIVSPGRPKAPEAPSSPPSEGLPSAAPPIVAKGPGLGTKFFLAAALLVVTTLGLAVAVATIRANQVAEKSIHDALAKVPAVYSSYQSAVDGQLRVTLRSIAEEPGTKALMDPNVTNATLWDWAQSKAKTLNAKTVFLFDRAGNILTRSDKPSGEDVGRPFRTVKWVLGVLETGGDATAKIREGKVVSTVASVPVVTGDMSKGEMRLDGVLAAAVPFDANRAEELQGLTRGQVGFLADTAKKGEPPNPEVAAATEDFRPDALVAALKASPGALDALFTRGQEIGPLDVVVDGDRRILKAVPIKRAEGETIAAFVVSRSRDEETAAFRQIRNTLIGIGIIALLASIPVSLLMGRRIARPLEQLAAGAVAIRDGNLDVKLPEAGKDEVGALARAFSAMVGELKEKAQLEEMLAEIQRRPGDVTHSGATMTPVTAFPAEGTKPGMPSMPKPGRLFGNRYEILSELGKGGMGAVFRALDRELEDDVALKVLMPEAFEEGTIAVQTLKQEIRLARKITHQNVVRTHDLGETDGVRFLTMEYVPGTTLREVIDRKGAVSFAPGIQIAKQVCRGLAAVHEAGIIHRDLKPQNIMVLPNGVVKLMDFGIARTTEGVDPNVAAGQTVGTPYYMSPEQAKGENLDARSDLYSLGVVLYELFTGVRPIEGRDPVDVMKRHVSADPERPSRVRSDMPDLLERIILACLAKNPDKRPPTANDLYGALMRVAA